MQVASDYRGGQESGGILIRGVEGLVVRLGVDVYFGGRQEQSCNWDFGTTKGYIVKGKM